MRHLIGATSEWTSTEYMLAQIIDQLNALAFIEQHSAAGVGVKWKDVPKSAWPKALLRPGEVDTTPKPKKMTTAELMQYAQQVNDKNF